MSIASPAGDTLAINDHVYLSSTPGEPFTIAWIMAFLPLDRVQVANYYRPEDITTRQNIESRLLYAAISTSNRSIADIRGKCQVRHKRQIADLNAWKATPDSFFFLQFFDSYIKREYEVVPTSLITNVTPNIQKTLVERFQFVICEREMVAGWKSEFETCKACSQWCHPAASTKCELCHIPYHLSCLGMIAKPSKGFSFRCAPCARQHDIEVESKRPPPPPKPKAKLTRQTGTLPISTQHFRGWPFRYFGQFTIVDDTLDPDDPIFPRAASRLGLKFQATWLPDPPAEARPEPVEDSGRGSDSSVTALNSEAIDTLAFDRYFKKAEKVPLVVPPSNLGRLTRTIDLFTKYSPTEALQKLKKSTKAELDVVEFLESEKSALLETVAANGGLDAALASKFSTRRPADCVRYYRIIREHQLQSYKGEALVPPTTSEPFSLLPRPASKVTRVCSACLTSGLSKCWSVPRGMGRQNDVWCELCAHGWAKYGKVPIGPLSATEKRASECQLGPAAKKIKPLTVSKPVADLLLLNHRSACACCSLTDGPNSPPILICSVCTFSVHEKCYGSTSASSLPSLTSGWKCDLCTAKAQDRCSTNLSCIYCPKVVPTPDSKGKGRAWSNSEPSYAQIFRPTLNSHHAHLLCATFLPDPQFDTDLSSITTAGTEHWLPETPCSLCKETIGAKRTCRSCPVAFHPSCAYAAGLTMGLEFTKASAKTSRVGAISFRGQTGTFSACIYCPAHEKDGHGRDRPIFPLYEDDPASKKVRLLSDHLSSSSVV